jgi:hypothetical protein
MKTTQTASAGPEFDMERTITLRRARHRDQPALWRLAALDSAPVLKGESLIAERNGDVIAAIGSDGRAIADPFEKTAAIISMLHAFTRETALAA